MHFAFTDEHDMFRDTVREIFASECSTEAIRESWDSVDGRVRGLWATLAEVGVLAIMAPTEVGGLGMDEVALVRVLEEAGYGGVPEPLVEHVAVAVPALATAGAAELLDAAISGESTCTVALATGGPNVVAPVAADLVVAEYSGSLLAVDSGALTVVPKDSIDQSRRLAEISYDPDAATLLAGADVALASDRAALGTAAQCVGVARRLLDFTVEYVKERRQFGKPVGSYQAVKHHLANVRLGIEFSAPLVYRAAWSVAHCDDAVVRGRDVSMAKATASDAVDRSCRAALQCHGAIGCTYEYDLQIWLKRGWSLSGAYGAASEHRDRVAGALGLLG
ncbi:MAG: acyl-CoA dehydrogenase [Acidimicrobiaceae bacterium]|nr:acyl-CoA/acyl-ACP dehydrogenase [Acidimicrobiaceae bacterium]MYA74454.1 acyl-CoA dehydrogenase [Acidimicrobiaceae bacterium]MYG54160.1 acyl-CoA dehydrogenase [Acidimicrobiaceae bacterium]MYJ97386.1 acyl-CoA dehydrogenase [Acidimicrobiaceae bacterium]